MKRRQEGDRVDEQLHAPHNSSPPRSTFYNISNTSKASRDLLATAEDVNSAY